MNIWYSIARFGLVKQFGVPNWAVVLGTLWCSPHVQYMEGFEVRPHVNTYLLNFSVLLKISKLSLVFVHNTK